MNRYFWLKASVIGTAVGVALVGGSFGLEDLPSSGFDHSPFTAADTMQAGLLHAGAKLGHLALKVFYFPR
jgi:hypothetical protein